MSMRKLPSKPRRISRYIAIVAKEIAETGSVEDGEVKLHELLNNELIEGIAIDQRVGFQDVWVSALRLERTMRKNPKKKAAKKKSTTKKKSVPRGQEWWRLIGKKIKELPDNKEGADKYAAFVKAWSGEVTHRSAGRFASKLVCHMPKTIRKAMSTRKPLYFLSADSAKVRHSAQHSISGVEQWFNAIVYLAPADQAAFSFEVIAPELVNPLIAAVKKAATQDKRWSALAAMNSTALSTFRRDVNKMKTTGVIPVRPPWMKNAVHPLSMCPYASPICRDVCLNTSEQASMMTDEMKLTREDSATLAWVQGKHPYYGGAGNSVIANRIARTHAIWAIWATEGVIQNSFNDHLYNEIVDYAKVCKAHGIRLAVRLNGTSDLPVETLRLTNGRNLISEAAKLGVVFYDYTKDHPRMHMWLDAWNWRGSRKPDGTIKGGMPGNYWLSFSWSENNLDRIMGIMRKGGNIVTVFRRSALVKMRKGTEMQLAKRASLEGVKIKNFNLTLGELTAGRYKGNQPLVIVDGDVSDLRFEDPRQKPGVIVGLIAKAKGAKGYTERDHKRVMDGVRGHFVVPIEMIGGKATIRTNPVETMDGSGAIAGTDKDLIEELTVDLGHGIHLGTTAEAT